MKIRKGFISNSSSSSFILPKGIDINEVKEFCKNTLIKETEKVIKKVEKTHLPSNWEEYSARLREDIKPENLERNINIKKVKDIDWDLSEWYRELNPEDYVLFDEDDNYLNWINEQLIRKYHIERYVLHMG